MLLSTSVYANDTSIANHEIHEDCLCELSEGSINTYDDNYVLDGTCYLGHWFTNTVHRSVGSHCIDFGDAYCRYSCMEGQQCTNCGTIVSYVYICSHYSCHKLTMHYTPWWS